MSEVAEFLTGQRPPVEVNRTLTTVLFTDIVASTERVAAEGDHRWRTLLGVHDRAVRSQLSRFGGKEIKTTGDGLLASFEGPVRAIRCAQAITEAAGRLGIELRAGAAHRRVRSARWRPRRSRGPHRRSCRCLRTSPRSLSPAP
jgi:class 3 adenylate cyclase